MSSLQPLAVEFAPYNSADFALLPSPSTFFDSQSPFNQQLPPTAAYAASPPSDQAYYSDSSNSAPSPANSFHFSALSQSSRSASPATSNESSPKLDNALLPCNSHNFQQSVEDFQPIPHQQRPIAPLSLGDAGIILSASGAAQHQELKYETYDYTQQRAPIQAPVAQYPSQYTSQAPLSLPVAYQALPQLGYNSVQPAYQHQQSNARTSNPGAPQQAAAMSYSYAQVQPYQQPQQQPQQHHFAAPPPAPFMATPSFETPQGTFYFVPNTSVQQPSVGIPVPSGLPMPMSMTHSRSQSSTSWDGDVDDSKLKSAVKKAPKKASGKNQTKRFICPHEGCGRAFARNFNMQSHLKSHLGIRDFDCPHCPKKFSRRHDRARHCAAVHDSHIPNDHARSAHHDEDEDEFEG